MSTTKTTLYLVGALAIGAIVTAAVRGAVISKDIADTPDVSLKAATDHEGHDGAPQTKTGEHAGHQGHDAAKLGEHAGHQGHDAAKLGEHAGHQGHDAAASDLSGPTAAGKIIDLKNDKCPVMGGKAQKDVFTDYEGVRVHFCCPGCDKTFMKDPKKYLKKLGIDDLDAYKKKHAKKKS